MFEFLFWRQDPSRQWRRHDRPALTLALDSGRLNAAQLGAPIDAASFLGLAEDRRAAKQGYFCYFSLGVAVACTDCQMINWLEIVYQDEFHEFQPYVGDVTFQGAKVELAGMTEREFLARFGDCYWRDQDEDESILFYEFPEREWQIEFNARGVLKRVQLCGEPVMAEEECRSGYGVTKPWPPGDATGARTR